MRIWTSKFCDPGPRLFERHCVSVGGSQGKVVIMGTEEGFYKIISILTAAGARGIKPAVRATRDEWVCTLEDSGEKSIIIAKEGELIVVQMELQKGEPEIERFAAPEYTRQEIIDRIQKAITEVYGA
jgi:hypothetical protein